MLHPRHDGELTVPPRDWHGGTVPLPDPPRSTTTPLHARVMSLLRNKRRTYV